MKRRQLLSVAAVTFAGCTTMPVKVVDVERTVTRKDSDILIRNLKVGSGDTEDCYHEYEGTIINQRNETLTDTEVAIHVYNRKGRKLSTVLLQFRLLHPEQIQEFGVANEGDCWDEEEAVDYRVELLS